MWRYAGLSACNNALLTPLWFSCYRQRQRFEKSQNIAINQLSFFFFVKFCNFNLQENSFNIPGIIIYVSTGGRTDRQIAFNERSAWMLTRVELRKGGTEKNSNELIKILSFFQVASKLSGLQALTFCLLLPTQIQSVVSLTLFWASCAASQGRWQHRMMYGFLQVRSHSLRFLT